MLYPAELQGHKNCGARQSNNAPHNKYKPRILHVDRAMHHRAIARFSHSKPRHPRKPSYNPGCRFCVMFGFCSQKLGCAARWLCGSGCAGVGCAGVGCAGLELGRCAEVSQGGARCGRCERCRGCRGRVFCLNSADSLRSRLNFAIKTGVIMEESTEKKNKRPTGYRTLVILTLINSGFVALLLISLNAVESNFYKKYFELSNESRDQRLRISYIETDIARDPVDFASEKVQDIGDGFYVVSAKQKQHMTGVIFSGRIINSKSIIFENIDFRISVGLKSKEFTLSKISPGNSTQFEVYIPDLDPKDAQHAKLRYVAATINYYTK